SPPATSPTGLRSSVGNSKFRRLPRKRINRYAERTMDSTKPPNEIGRKQQTAAVFGRQGQIQTDPPTGTRDSDQEFLFRFQVSQMLVEDGHHSIRICVSLLEDRGPIRLISLAA